MGKRIFFIVFLFIMSINAQKINEDIELIKLNDSFYIHKTFFDFPGHGRFPSNGLILIKNGKALLIDTPVTKEQTKAVYDHLRDKMSVEITEVIVCHYHEDCLGGLEYLHSLGISSIANELTKEKCEALNLPIPKMTFKETMVSGFEGESFICDYPGGGHSQDNIIVYFPESEILFGGCLIKAVESKSLGSVKDAVIGVWDKSVEKVIVNYPKVKTVIPGHGDHGGLDLLSHTVKLVEDYKKKMLE